MGIVLHTIQGFQTEGNPDFAGTKGLIMDRFAGGQQFVQAQSAPKATIQTPSR